ncbi:MAG: hypothetical protein J5I98_28175 [Phaeodactylibacter sp.]|nr:hypothetical protein [Phaeodactylibacter sp.]
MNSSSHIIKRQTLELHGLRQEDAREMQERMRRLCYSHLLPIIDRYLSRLSPNGQPFRIERLELDLGPIDALDFEAAFIEQLEIQLQAQLARLSPPPAAPGQEPPQPPEAPGARYWELFRHFVETGSLPWWAEPRAENLIVESLDYLLDKEPELLIGTLREWLPHEQYLRRLVRQASPDRLVRLAGLQVRLSGGQFETMAESFFQVLEPLSAALGIVFSRLMEEARLKLLQVAFFNPARITEAKIFWQEWLLQLAVVFRVKYERWLEALQTALSEATAAGPSSRAGAAAIVQHLAKTHQEEKRQAAPPPPAANLFQAVFETLAEVLREAGQAADDILEKGNLPPAIINRLAEELRKEGQTASAGAKAADSVEATFQRLIKELREEGRAIPASARAADSLQALSRRLAKRLREEEQPASADSKAADSPDAIFQLLMEELQEEGQETPTAAQAADPLRAIFQHPAGREALSSEAREVLARAFRAWPPPPSPADLKVLGRLLEAILGQNEKIRPALAKKWASHLGAIFRETTLPGHLQEELPLLLRKLRQGNLGRAEITSILQILAAARPQQPAQKATGRRRAAEEKAADPADNQQRDAFSKTSELFIDNAGLVILWSYLPRFFQSLGLLDGKQFVDAAAAHRAAGLLQYLADGKPEAPEYLLAFNKILCGLPWDEVLDFGGPVTEAEAEECDVFLQAVIANAPILKNMSVDGFRGTFLLRRGMLRQLFDMWELHVERETYDVVLDKFPWSWKVVKLPWLEKVIGVGWGDV